MADRYYSGASGLWSTLANWDNYQSLSYPTSVDDVYANGKTVTINQDINVLSIRTTTTPQTSTAGGRFQLLTNGYTLTTDIIAGTTEGLYVNLSADTNTLNIIGNITGGTSGSAHGLLNVSAGTINITASKGLIQTGNIAHLFSNTGRGTINSTATTMTTSRSANGYGSYINNTGGGTINLYATEIGGGDNTNAHAIINNNGNVTVSATTFSSGTGTSAYCLNSIQATSSISANTNMYGTNFLNSSGSTVFIFMNASGVVNAIADVTDRIPSVPIGSAAPSLVGVNTNAWARINVATTPNGTATTVNFAGSNITNCNGDADLSAGGRTGGFFFNGNNNCSLNISADSFSFNTSVADGFFIQSTNTTANFNTGTINIVGRNTDKVKVYYVNPNILLNAASRVNPSFIRLTNGCSLNAKLTDVMSVPSLTAGTGSGYGVRITDGTANIICDNVIGASGSAANHTVSLNGSGIINITGSSYILDGGGTGTGSYLVANTGSGVINVTGNRNAKIYRTETTPNTYGVLGNTSTGNINFIALGDGSLTGSVITNPYGNATSTISNTSTGNINITANTFYVNSAVTNANVYAIYNAGSATVSNPTINAYFNKTYLIPSSTLTTGTDMIRLGGAGAYGTINFTGTDIAGNNSSAGINNVAANGTININCVNISGGTVAGAYGIYNGSTGVINVTADTILSTAGHGIYVSTTGGIINVTGNTFIMGTGAGHGMYTNNGTINAYFNDSYRLVGTSSSTGAMLYATTVNSFINFKGGKIESGYGTNAFGAWATGGGIINITGNTLVVNTGTTAHGLYIDGTAIKTTINMTANTNATSYRVGNTVGNMVNNSSAIASSVINCIGTEFSGGSGSASYGIYNTQSTVNVTGKTFGSGGGATSYGIYNSNSGTINVTGDTFVVGTGATAHGAYLTNGTINAYFNDSYRLVGTTASTGSMLYASFGTINFKGKKIESGYGSSAYGAWVTAGGTINITGDTLVINSGATAHGFYADATAPKSTINMTANTNSNIVRSSNTSGIIIYNNAANSTTVINYTCNGDISTGDAASTHGIHNNSLSTINVTANTLSIGTGTTSYGIYNQTTGRVNAVINKINPSNIYGNHSVYNLSTGRIDLSATTISASNLLNTYSIYSTTAGIINVTGDTISSSNNSPAIYSTSTTGINNIVYGNLIFTNGITPVFIYPYASSRLVANTSNNSYIIMEDTNNTYETFASTGFTGLESSILPVSGNVRNGITYGYSGISSSYGITGSSIIPPASAVTYGTLYDKTTTGTSVISIYDFGTSITISGQTV